MKKIIKHIIKNIIPPICFELLWQMRNKAGQTQKYGWFGDYATWKDAKSQCSGYDDRLILEKVKESLLKIKNNEAVYERDSVLFSEVHYSWPLLSGLLRANIDNQGKLDVLDFGGSLGSSYYQNRKFLSVAKELKWNIVEQKHFVDNGREFFQNEDLKFYYSIEECLKTNNCNVLLLSGVLQYLDSPIIFLKTIINNNFDYIIIDRTSFIEGNKNRITVQRVPSEIYKADYPCWFFNEEELLDCFGDVYTKIACFDAIDKSNIDGSYFKGFILKQSKC